MGRRLFSRQRLLTEIREQAKLIRAGEKARVRRDNLFEAARDREDVSIEELAKAAGVTVNAVKFARASRRRKLAKNGKAA
jgi:hypothetical protein